MLCELIYAAVFIFSLLPKGMLDIILFGCAYTGSSFRILVKLQKW